MQFEHQGYAQISLLTLAYDLLLAGSVALGVNSTPAALVSTLASVARTRTTLTGAVHWKKLLFLITHHCAAVPDRGAPAATNRLNPTQQLPVLLLRGGAISLGQR